MDHFGIGLGIKGAAQVYLRAARQTGRTTSLADSLKDGDCVCCATQAESNNLERELRKRKLKVRCIVLSPSERSLGSLSGMEPPIGRFIFDHGWVEEFYLRGIGRCEREIDEWQKALSRDKSELDFNEAMREVMLKWRI